MSKCWYCNNELTTGDSPKHFGICNKCYDEMFKSSDRIIRSFTNKISDLETKLAEKEKEIEDLKNNHYLLKKDYIVDYFVSQTNEPMPIPKFVTNQDKISFCIEKLEKVKELMRNIDMPNKPELYNNDMFGAGFDSHYIRVEKLIDNQINELKEEIKNE